jgi:Tol biopolymer transport system component
MTAGPAGAPTRPPERAPQPQPHARAGDHIPPLPPVVGEPEPASGRRPPWAILGGVAAAVVVAVVAILALGGGGGDDDDGGAAGSTGSSAATGATGGSGATDATGATGAGAVPQGPALADTTLVMKVNTEPGVSEIQTLDVGAGTTRPVTQNGSGRSWVPVLSPDRRSIAYTWSKDDQTAELRVAASDGTGDRLVADDIDGTSRAAWSNDGTRLAYIRLVNAQRDLVVVDLATGDTTLLTDDRVDEGDPAWSPDDRRIALWKFETDQRTHLYLLDVASRQATKITGADASDADPVWSPDGDLIAFSRTPPGSPSCSSLFVYDDASGQATQVTDGTQDQRDDRDPTWSPNGSQLAFEFRAGCADAANFQIGVVQANGSGFRALTQPDADRSHPAWR